MAQDAKTTRGELGTVHPLPSSKKTAAKKAGAAAATAKKSAAKKTASTGKPSRSA
ncbi:hypothetical protein [Streptomyces sp. NPDC051546]|uniref:hypothetical protein n=1 Tax=Streptomyces sp. NPDC051546 TaxID=3365655 RepID=UPI0037902DCD